MGMIFQQVDVILVLTFNYESAEILPIGTQGHELVNFSNCVCFVKQLKSVFVKCVQTSG